MAADRLAPGMKGLQENRYLMDVYILGDTSPAIILQAVKPVSTDPVPDKKACSGRVRGRGSAHCAAMREQVVEDADFAHQGTL